MPVKILGRKFLRESTAVDQTTKSSARTQVTLDIREDDDLL
jgi:hypothetical protein